MDSGHLRTSPGPTKRRKVDGDNGDGNAQASGSGSSSRTGNNSGHGNGNGNGGDTKKRPVSCDVCRARKVKCVKQEGAERCDGCVSLDQVCSYTHERKKPGPANRSVPQSLGPLAPCPMHYAPLSFPIQPPRFSPFTSFTSLAVYRRDL